LLYDKIGFYDKAISDFNAGIKLDPDDEDFYLSRAASFNAQAKFDDALNDVNKAIQLKPMNVSGYSTRAWSKWMYKKDYQGAIEDISMVITIDEENAHAYLVRARLYQQLNKQNLAQADLNKVVELNDSSSTLAYALILQNKLQEANTLIDTLIKNDSTDYYDYACMYSLMNVKVKAVDYLRKALENGWRDFVHLDNDPDIDNIRNTQEYKSLLIDYKSKYKKELSDYGSVNISNSTAKNADRQVYAIPIKKLKSNLYEVICSVNGVPMKFIYDTGASGVLLSRTEADFLLKNGYLKNSDFGKKNRSKIANGSIVEGISLKIRTFKIGDLELENIDGSVIDNSEVDLLLGQSVLQKFGKIEIDNEKSIMTIVVDK
jgi:clan AA aspartic protease (TIGR02281 family)